MSTNLNQNTESPKLKIVTTVTEKITKNVDKELQLPYYFTSGTQLFKVISEDYTLRVHKEKDWWGVKTLPTKLYNEEIAEGTPCTPDEFEAAYSQAMMYIDAIYRNEEPSTEADENEQIDQILQDKIDGRAA